MTVHYIVVLSCSLGELKSGIVPIPMTILDLQDEVAEAEVRTSIMTSPAALIASGSI